MKPEDDASASRRQFVGGMTAGLATAFVSPGLWAARAARLGFPARAQPVP